MGVCYYSYYIHVALFLISEDNWRCLELSLGWRGMYSDLCDISSKIHRNVNPWPTLSYDGRNDDIYTYKLCGRWISY